MTATCQCERRGRKNAITDGTRRRPGSTLEDAGSIPASSTAHEDGPMTAQTWAWAGPWWGTLVAVNVLSLLVGVYLFARPIGDVEPGDVRYVRTMRTLGLIFVRSEECR